MSTAYIALGANLDDPAATIRAAFGALANLPDSRVVACSSLYRTAPIDCAPQPDFINAVAALETTLPPETLLTALLDLETRFGRTRSGKNGPRTLDLDLLLYADQIIALPKLTLPHPRLHLRAFVLYPLTEIAPEVALPGRGKASAWLPAVANQGIRKL